jgi:hypothetical protein
MNIFRGLISRHGLVDKWKAFTKQFELEE